MKKIFLIILFIFTIFVSSFIITKAAVSEAAITIYEYDTLNSNEINSLDCTSSFFKSKDYVIENTESDFILEEKISSRYLFKGYYQYFNNNYTFFNPNQVIKYDENSNNVYYEYWEIIDVTDLTYEVKIYEFNTNSTNLQNSLNIDSNYFEPCIYFENYDSEFKNKFILPNQYSIGWIFKGYYQIIDDNYVFYQPNDIINIDLSLSYEFYEYWEKNNYDFTYYIFYNKNDVPQEFYIDGILEFNDFIVKFPTSYKNLTATSFKTTDSSILTIDEIYDGYLTSVSNNSSSYGILNAEFKIKNEIEDEPVEDTDDKFVFSEWWNEIGFEIKLIVLIIFLLIILLILSLFTGKRRYRRKW